MGSKLPGQDGFIDDIGRMIDLNNKVGKVLPDDSTGSSGSGNISCVGLVILVIFAFIIQQISRFGGFIRDSFIITQMVIEKEAARGEHGTLTFCLVTPTIMLACCIALGVWLWQRSRR